MACGQTLAELNMLPFTLPADYPRVKVVQSFDELVGTPFANGINALCWERTLHGDFIEVLQHLKSASGITTIEVSQLLALAVSEPGKAAIETLLDDQRLLRDHGLAPVLETIHEYPHDDPAAVLSTDVYSFHVDSATVQTDTYLCTYHGSPSEGLRNEQARPQAEIPEIRSRLLSIFGGEDNPAFTEYLKENCYDLHYAPTPGARPFSFGKGNLWRIAVDYPGSPVPPCIHRAPQNLPGQPPRLLLIS